MRNSGIWMIGAAVLAMGCGIAAAQTSVVGIAVDSQGNVGIGTETPSKKLHVTGDMLVEGGISGTGGSGQFGSAAQINGFDSIAGGIRPFFFTFDNTQPAGQQIRIATLSPLTPGQSTFKTFVIQNPVSPDRYLVHASLEGPEGAVYYRGSARLQHGAAIVALPHYFEALTRKTQRTVHLTNVDGFDRIAVALQGGERVHEGAFKVVSDNRKSNQQFDWEVIAVRGDGPPLETEPMKKDRVVAGLGPYTYAFQPVAAQGTAH
jgi:hypothetical protein